jgi:hypothetical protein
MDRSSFPNEFAIYSLPVSSGRIPAVFGASRSEMWGRPSRPPCPRIHCDTPFVTDPQLCAPAHRLYQAIKSILERRVEQYISDHRQCVPPNRDVISRLQQRRGGPQGRPGRRLCCARNCMPAQHDGHQLDGTCAVVQEACCMLTAITTGAVVPAGWRSPRSVVDLDHS